MKTNKNTFLENRLIFQFTPEEGPQTPAPAMSETPEEAYDRLSKKIEEIGSEKQNTEITNTNEINALNNKLDRLSSEIYDLLFQIDKIDNKETYEKLEDLKNYVNQLSLAFYEVSDFDMNLYTLKYDIKEKMPDDKWIDSFLAMPEESQEHLLVEICYLNRVTNNSRLSRFHLGNVEFWEDFYNEFKVAQHDGRKVNWKEFVKKYR